MIGHVNAIHIMIIVVDDLWYSKLKVPVVAKYRPCNCSTGGVLSRTLAIDYDGVRRLM